MPRRSEIKLGKASKPLRLMPIIEGSDEKEPILWQIGRLGQLMQYHIDNNKYGVTRGWIYGYLIRYDTAFRQMGIWGHLLHEKIHLSLNKDFYVILNIMWDLRRREIISGCMVMDACFFLLKKCKNNDAAMSKVGEIIYTFYGYDAVFIRCFARRYPEIATKLNTVLCAIEMRK